MDPKEVPSAHLATAKFDAKLYLQTYKLQINAHLTSLNPRTNDNPTHSH